MFPLAIGHPLEATDLDVTAHFRNTLFLRNRLLLGAVTQGNREGAAAFDRCLQIGSKNEICTRTRDYSHF